MAKLSGLIGAGRVGTPDQKTLNAMPDAPTLDSSIEASKNVIAPPLESSAPVKAESLTSALDSSAAPQSTTEAKVSSIRPSPFQVRAAADPEYIETLMSSIMQSGVISPIVVRQIEDDVFEVIAGYHRLEASRRLGRLSVPVVIRNLTDSEAARALTSDNFVRKELSDFERYKHAKLLKDHGFCRTKTEIGDVLGCSRQLVGFLFSFDEFPHGARAVLEVNPSILGASQANEIKDLARDKPEAFTEALKELADGKIRQNQIRHWIESKFKTPALRMRSRQEVKIQKPGLPSAVKIVYTDREAKIQADGLDVDLLRRLIEDNLDSLIKH